MSEENFNFSNKFIITSFDWPRTLPGEVKAKAKANKTLARIELASQLLELEDKCERKALHKTMPKLIVLKMHYQKWVMSLTYNNAPAPKRPAFGFGFITEDGPQDYMISITYSSFEQAEAWLEKNAYFGLQSCKYHEGVYASWD